MNSYTLSQSIKAVFTTYYDGVIPIKFQGVLSSIDHVISHNHDETQALSSLKVILEGVYQALPDNINLKNKLQFVRNEAWGNFAGLPTKDFIAMYDKQIKQTKNSVKNTYWASFNHNEYSVMLTDMYQTKS